jgi:hypothetical protein
MFMSFHLLKSFSNPSYSLFLFQPPTWIGHADANVDRRAYISVWEVSFAKFLFVPSWFVHC